VNSWPIAVRACCLACGAACWLAVPTHSGQARAQQADNGRVDAIFADLARPGSPGCALGVYRNGTIIYSKEYGLANLENEVPITPQTVFDVGSIAKQFTAASVVLLEQQGKLRLDDEVHTG
jgi:CubicO group peptidase (beta-lactamase class C family)